VLIILKIFIGFRSTNCYGLSFKKTCDKTLYSTPLIGGCRWLPAGTGGGRVNSFLPRPFNTLAEYFPS